MVKAHFSNAAHTSSRKKKVEGVEEAARNNLQTFSNLQSVQGCSSIPVPSDKGIFVVSSPTNVLNTFNNQFGVVENPGGDIHNDINNPASITMSQTSLDNWNLNPEEEDGLPNSGKGKGYRQWTMDSSRTKWWASRKFFFVKSWILALLAIIVLLWVAVLFLLLLPSKNSENFDWWVGDQNHDSPSIVNDRPIIGILAQEYQFYSHHGNEDGAGLRNDSAEKAYIAASYIKFVEGAGAQAVPILINRNKTYLKYMFNSVNGILFPGGAVPLDSSSGYGEAGRYLYELSTEANQNGDYFPLWGTCLGFEFMMFAGAGYREVRTDCAAWNVVNRLKFTEGAGSSRLYGNADKNVIGSLGTKNVTVNFHKFCVTPDNFTAFDIDQNYRILSVNYDSVAKLTYVSSVESKKFPFYAVQFHPEKNIYEWTTKEVIPHSPEAISSAQYFGNFFVNEARKNKHKFEEGDESQYLIYNYQPEFSGSNGSTFEQLYFFPI